jgi:hypothetical protein
MVFMMLDVMMPGRLFMLVVAENSIKKRIGKHIRDLKANRHINHDLQDLWNSKGLTFTHVIKCLPIKKLVLEFEKAHGAQYDFKKLMNVNPLGKAGSDNSGENNPNLGKETWNKGKSLSQETRGKMSEAQKGENHYTAKMSPKEYIEKMGRNIILKILHQEVKTIGILQTLSGNG